MTKQSTGACLRFTGIASESPGDKQPIELQVNDPNSHKLTVLGECDPSKYIFASKNRIKLLQYTRHVVLYITAAGIKLVQQILDAVKGHFMMSN